MTREQRLTNLFHAFDMRAEAFCRDTGGSYFEIVPTYKGNRRDAQSLKYRSAYIFYNSFAVEFKYTAHGTMSLANSILECLIIPDKSRDGISIPLPLFLDYCDKITAIPLCIPSIIDGLGLDQAFDCICSVLNDTFTLIADVCANEEKRLRVFDSFISEMSALLNVEINDENIKYYFDKSLYSFLTLRLTSAHFINYIKGDLKTATKQLGKVKDKLGYEKSLLEEMKSGKITTLPDLSSIREALKTYSKGGVQNTSSGKEFFAMFLSWIVLCLGFSAIYLALFFLLVYIEGRSSIYLMGPIYNFPYCILCGFITAIAASYFIRFKAYKLLFPKDFDRFQATDQIQNGTGSDKLMKGFLTVLIICSLIGCVLFAKWNINFGEYGFTDNSKFFSVSGEYHSYEDVDRIYYKSDRVNDFGDTLDFPSYVIVLKSGQEIDLYEYGEIEEYEDTLLEQLKEKGVRIEGPTS